MMRILLSLLLVVGTVGAASAQTAADSPGSYSATVPVAGTSDVQRNEAMSVALGNVLQQVSPGFVATPDVLAQASGYVRDFHYRRAASGGLELQVDFDPGAIGRMIAQGQSSAVAAAQPGSAGSTGVPAAASGGSGTLWVGGIDNSHAFASLLAVLRGDAALHDVIPVAASGDGVLVRLTSDLPLATVLAALTGPTGHLAPALQPHPGADAALRWTP